MNAKVRQAGFSIIEMLVVIGIFSLVIIAASQSFVPLLSQSKQQSKIAATNIEGMLGLEVMRRDIAHAGFGLYWNLDPKSAPTTTPTYTEVTVADDLNGAALNDAPSGFPRPIVIGGGRGLNGSDRIAVKAVNVALNELSERWTYLYTSPIYTTRIWSPSTENIGSGEYVIVVRPDQTSRSLHFTKAFASSSLFNSTLTNYEVPETTSLVFSLGTTSTPKMAFNRADYYIANTTVPTRCAQGTGVLYKAVVNQIVNATSFQTPMSLLDCVADMQVAYRYAADGGAYADILVDVPAVADQPLDSIESRNIREVRVYILVQEGQRDRDFTYSNNIVRVGEAGIGRDFDLNATITNWQNYRWKLYTIIIQPICLLGTTVTP